MAEQRRAVFLDRDGTIGAEQGYLRHAEHFRLQPGSGQAVRALNAAGWLAVVITNQSGVDRGFIGRDALDAINAAMVAALAVEGATIAGIYVCRHAPWEDCDCRKPQPGLLRAAAADLNIDLAASWMVGDKAADVGAGRNAGCRTAFLLSGWGRIEREWAPPSDLVCHDLAEAARTILGEDAREVPPSSGRAARW